MIAVRRLGTIDPAAIRRAAARAYPKLRRGTNCVPDYVVDQMFAEYRELRSLSKTAARYGRTKQDLAYIFKRRGLPVGRRGGQNRKAA